jgi:Ca2+-binding RTX toxin-like protein
VTTPSSAAAATQTGASWLFGGDGYDTVSYGLSASAVGVNLLDGNQNTGDAAGHVYIGIEAFLLSSFDDTFIGSDLADIVDGNRGNDTLIGNGGNDILDGGQGDDWLYGGDGNDVLHGGTAALHHHGGPGGDDVLSGGNGDDTLDAGDGNDVLSGGTGADILSGGDGYDIAGYYDAAAAVSIDLTHASSTWTGEAQGDVLSSIEEFGLTGFADIFKGDINDNVVFGGDGDDQINGLGGNDTLWGGTGNDSVFGGDGNDIVYGDTSWPRGGDDYLQGNAGDDTLIGGYGNDRMVGGTGNDVLIGGMGGDYMVGDAGTDTFRFADVLESQNRLSWGVKQLDTIVDFTQGQDKIDLSLIDANAALAGDQAFTFLDDPSHYTGDWSGKVWETTDARTGIATLNVSINSDGGAEMQIYMSHAYTFTANNFLL